MSEQIHYKGKIKLEEKLSEKETLQEQCKRILTEHNVDLSEVDDYVLEFVGCFYNEEYVIVDEDIYKILSIDGDTDDYDVYNVHDNLDGTFDYEVSFYDGGCCLGEAISCGFEEMKRRQKKYKLRKIDLEPNSVLMVEFDKSACKPDDLKRLFDTLCERFALNKDCIVFFPKGSISIDVLPKNQRELWSGVKTKENNYKKEN